MAISPESPTSNERNAVPATCGRHSDHPSLLLETLLEKMDEGQPSASLSPAQSELGTAQGKIIGVVIGRLVGFDASNRFLVRCTNIPTQEPLVAVAMVALGRQDIDREVALSFIEGNPYQPVILGLLHVAAQPSPKAGEQEPNTVRVRRDHEQLVLSAEREIVLRCGESSITLTKEGKITIRGKHLLSRAEGVNRIKGGAVQIN